MSFKKSKKTKNRLIQGPIDVINFDELIPDNLKLKHYNKYEDMIRHPAMVILSGSTGGGKTNVLLNMLMRMVITGKVYIFLKDETEDKYLYLTKLFKEMNDLYNHKFNKNRELKEIFEINTGVKEIPDLHHIDKEVQNVLIFDDLVTEKETALQKVEELYILARKRNCTLFFLTQSFFAVPRKIRNNSFYLLLFECPNNTEIRNLSKEYSGGIDFECFKNMLVYATSEPYSFFLLDKKSTKKEDKFRKKFSERLDPNQFQQNQV